MMFTSEKRLEFRNAFLPISFRSSLFPINRISFLANSFMSSSGIKKPSSPFLIMSLGPHGQEKDTTGNPNDSASNIAMEKPSLNDETASMDEFVYSSSMLSDLPFRNTELDSFR